MKFPFFAIVCRIVPMLVLLGAWGCWDQNGSEGTKEDSSQQRVAIEKLRFSAPTWEVSAIGNTPAGEMKRSILELSDNVIPIQEAISPENFKVLGIERVEPLIEEVPGFPISDELRCYVVVHYSQKLPSDMLLTHVKRHQYVRDAIEKVDVEFFSDDFPDVQNESQALELGYLWHLEDNASNIAPDYFYHYSYPPNHVCSGQCNGINAYNAWERLTDQHQEVVVAVLDDGVDYTHPDLEPVLWNNSGEGLIRDGVDNDGNGYIDDLHGITFLEPITITDPTTSETCPDWAVSSGQGGQVCNDWVYVRKSANHPCDPEMTAQQPLCDHGTSVAGLIASEHNSSDTGGEIKGLMRGSCPMCRLMPIQLGLYVDDLRFPQLARGLYYAYVNGAKVVNLSIGLQSGKLGRQLMDFFATKMIVVAAAGNDDLEEAIPGYYNSWFYPDDQPPYAFPASHNAVISVGNLGPDGTKDPSSQWNDAIDVFTPANLSVMSTVNSQFWSNFYSSSTLALLPGFYLFGGTSAASPITAGVAGMIASHYQYLTGRWPNSEEVRAVLRQTADKLPRMYGENYNPRFGYGRVDAEAALVYLEEQLAEDYERVPFVKIIDPVMDSISTGTLKVRVLYSVPKNNSNVQLSLDISHENQFAGPTLRSVQDGFSETFDASGLAPGEYEQVWEFDHILEVEPGRYKIEIQAGDAYDATHVFLGGLHIVSPYARCKGDDVTHIDGIYEDRLSFRGYVDASFDSFEVLFRRVEDEDREGNESNFGITLVEPTDPKSCPQAEDIMKYGTNRSMWTLRKDSELWVMCDLLALLDLDKLRTFQQTVPGEYYFMILKGKKGSSIYRDVIRVDMYPRNVFTEDSNRIPRCLRGDEYPDVPDPIDDSCDYPQGDCDGTPGCEVNLSNDVHNCGECGTDCENLFSPSIINGPGELFGAISFSCVDGQCVVDECAEGFSDCNGDPSDGCEVFTDGSSCEANCLNDGWLDCNGDYTDGCETDVMNDLDNCGECGNECEVLNGMPSSCIEGECVQGDQCLDDYYDLDENPANGCECSIDQYSSKKSNCDLSAPRDTCDPDLCIYGGVMDDLFFWIRNPKPEIVRVPDSILDFKLLYPVHGFDPQDLDSKPRINTKMESCRVTQGDSTLGYCFEDDNAGERYETLWFPPFLTDGQMFYETWMDFTPCVGAEPYTTFTDGYWCPEQVGRAKRWGNTNDLCFHDILGDAFNTRTIAKGFWFYMQAEDRQGHSDSNTFYVNVPPATNSFTRVGDIQFTISGRYAYLQKSGRYFDLQPVGSDGKWVKVTLDQSIATSGASISASGATADLDLVINGPVARARHLEKKYFNWGGMDETGQINNNLMVGTVVDGKLRWEVDEGASAEAPQGRMYPLLIGNIYDQNLVLLDGFRPPTNFTHGTVYEKTVYLYRPNTGTWSTGPAMPEEREARALSSVVYDETHENAYLFGGARESEFMNDLWRLHLPSMTWEELSPLPEAGRVSVGMEYVPERNEIMLAGGVAPGGEKRDVWVYHIDSDSWYKAIDALQAVSSGPMLMRHDPKSGTVGIAGRNWNSISQVDTATYAEVQISGVYGDCNDDGTVESRFGQLCTPSKDWWDAIGNYTCYEENVTCTAESRDASWKGSYITLRGVNAVDVDTEEDRIYVATSFGVDIVSTNVDYLPFRIGWISSDGAVKDVKRYQERVLFLDHRGLVVAEDSSTLFPTIVATVATSAPANALEISGDRAYIATDLGLEVVNIADIDHPYTAAQHYTDYSATDVTIGDGVVYLAGFHLMLVGMEGSEAPGYFGSLDTGKEIEHLRYYNGYLYLNEVDGYPHVYKVGQQFGELVDTGSHSIPYWVHGVVGRGDRVFRAGTLAVHQRKLD